MNYMMLMSIHLPIKIYTPKTAQILNITKHQNYEKSLQKELFNDRTDSSRSY